MLGRGFAAGEDVTSQNGQSPGRDSMPRWKLLLTLANLLALVVLVLLALDPPPAPAAGSGVAGCRGYPPGCRMAVKGLKVKPPCPVAGPSP
jgi:hypothetical protein